jgi:hypothetical protein
MPMTCKLCRDPRQRAINKAYASGQSNRAIGRQFGVTKDCAQRHRKHIKAAVTKAVAKRKVRRGTTVVTTFEGLVKQATDSLGKATTDGAKIGWHGVLQRYMQMAKEWGIDEQRRRDQEKERGLTDDDRRVIAEVMRG